jgi:acyl-CoA synthetase (AMP-forming)/AMP-acid ligase II
MEWNAADLIEAVADVAGDREALVVDGGPRLTWSELDARASALANHLIEAGVNPQEHVACYMANGNEYLETMLACFKARAVPINVNWRYKAGEIAYLFDDADVVACVIDPEFVPVLEEAKPRLPRLRYILTTGKDYENAISRAPKDRPFVGQRSADDRYILYTGGTTGMPKGVVWRQEDIIGAVWRVTAGLDMSGPPEQVKRVAENPRSRYLALPPFMHGAAHWGAFGVWLGGGCVLARRGTRFDAEASLAFAEREKPNMALIVGDAFAAPIVEAMERARAEGRPFDVSSLKILISSGAPLSLYYKKKLSELFPGLMIVDTLGSSESGLEAVAASRGNVERTRFVPDESTIVLDEETLKPLEPGSQKIGVVAKTGFLPLGYYKDPEKTARTFPTVDGKRYVLTGDHAIVEADGTIVLLGRGSACINTGGEKVYPEEVEAALKMHPVIRDALVVGVPDRRFGSVVAAVVELDEGSRELSLEEVRSFLADKLANYKHPRYLAVADRVRRAPSGKPDYGWAREFLAEALGLAVTEQSDQEGGS